MRGGTMLVFEPRDRSVKPLKVPAWFSLDAPFEAWLARLPDLATLERARSEAELLASPALGATVSERTASLARARLVAHLLNWPGLAIALWVFVFPRPYLLAVTTAFLFPLLALGAAALGRGAYQLLGKRNDARPALFLALFVPWACASVRAFDFDLVAPGTLLVPALLVGAVLTALAFLGDRSLRERPAWALLILPLLAGASAAGVTVANGVLDRSSPRVHEAVVLGKRVTTGKGAARLLKLGPWGPRTAPDQVNTSRAVYDAVAVDEPVRIHLYEGRLGLQWFRVAGPDVTAAPGPLPVDEPRTGGGARGPPALGASSRRHRAGWQARDGAGRGHHGGGPAGRRGRLERRDRAAAPPGRLDGPLREPARSRIHRRREERR